MKTTIALLGFMSAAAAVGGVRVGIELPKAPGKYLVTVAAAPAEKPDFPIATFVAGEVFSTEAGTNRFSVEWNGLDDNHMPVPPGRYAIKAVYAPAKLWPVDGQYHAFTARYAGGIGSMLPPPGTPEIWKVPLPASGDPVNSPMADVAATPDGRAVFGFTYMENGRSCPLLRLKGAEAQPEFIANFPSGGAAGGLAVTTDGTTVWGVSRDNSPDFLYRPDAKPFGRQNARYRRGVRMMKGEVTDLAYWKRPDGETVVAATENGILSEEPWMRGHMKTVVSKTEFADVVTLLLGKDGTELGQRSVRRPRALAVLRDTLYVLFRPTDETWAIGTFPLREGLPAERMSEVRPLDIAFAPGDLAVDSRGRLFVSDPAGNRVWRIAASGKPDLAVGKAGEQPAGAYDPEIMMKPRSLATWLDPQGRDRLLVVERDGVNRTSEWDAGTGAYLGEYQSYQTCCNSGYTFDPEHPDHAYLPVAGRKIARFVFDYAKGTWKTDAIFGDVSAGMRGELDKFVAVRRQGRLYLASERTGWVYRLTDDGKRLLRSAAFFPAEDGKSAQAWHDENGDGVVDENEKSPCADYPNRVFTYHGQSWLQDLSYVAAQYGGRGVWRVTPARFDRHGNPVFERWVRVLEDPHFAARAKGRPGALEGGNELEDRFSSTWVKCDGDLGKTLYVQARGGRGSSANYGAQYKISRYDADGKGGYGLTWRVGRVALERAGRADLYGAMRLFKPLNGILAVIDQTRSGVYLYTDSGLYLDTLFAPGNFSGPQGVYLQPGEFFAGTVYPNRDNGKIFYAAGKFTPLVYEIENWTMSENPVRTVPRHTRFVTVRDGDIADPPPKALQFRGGAGKATVCSFGAATGGVSLKDGTEEGWVTAPEVAFADVAGTSAVKVRALWNPDWIFLRWHVRKPVKADFKPLPPPERLFTHDIGADTVGFYFHGDADARFTFGLFRDAKGDLQPLGVGFYPKRPKLKKVSPQAYRTPVGEAAFAHVGPVEGARYGHCVDRDGKGFVLSVALPRSALPFDTAAALSSGYRTRLNFDANLGGHNRFWWANVDGSANVDTYDEPSEARIYPGSWSQGTFRGLPDGLVLGNWWKLGPFGGEGAKAFNWNPSNKDEVRRYYQSAKFSPDDGSFDRDRDYAGPETVGHWKAERSVKWTRAEMAALDCRAIFAKTGAQLFYGTSFFEVPEDCEVELELYTHAQTFVDWTLNGEPLNVPVKVYKPDKRLWYRSFTTVRVKLRKGVNELRQRSFCVGYAPVRVGAAIRADEKLLWRIRPL